MKKVVSKAGPPEGAENSGGGGGHSDGYSSSAATNESRPDSFGTRSDARSNMSAGDNEESKAEMRQAEEEEANQILKNFIIDVRPVKSPTNIAGGYTADNLGDLFILLGMQVAIEDIKAALPQTENPLLTDEEVLATVHTVRTAQHVDMSRVIQSIEACIVRLNPFRFCLYKLGCLSKDEDIGRAALVKLDWNVQPKHRLFLSIAAVLVVVGTLMVVVIALLWVSSTYAHVTSQLRDIQRITQLSATHLQTSDFKALGDHLQGQTESVMSLLRVRDNDTEQIVRTRASDDVMLLATMINKSDVLYLFTPMTAALHGLKVVLGGTAATAADIPTSPVTTADIFDLVGAWDSLPALKPYRKFVFDVPTPAALRGPTPPAVGSSATGALSSTAFDVAGGYANITMIYDSETDATKRCMTTNRTVGNTMCDGGPLFFKNRYVGLSTDAALSSSFVNATVFNASSPLPNARSQWPSNEATFYDTITNISNYFASGGDVVVRMSRSLSNTGGGNGIHSYDVNADGTITALGSAGSTTLDASFIENATALYISIYIPIRGIAIVASLDRDAMIELRKPEVIAMSSQINAHESGTSMVTRRGSLVAMVSPTTAEVSWITPLTRLIHDCYKTTPKTCTAQDDLVRRSWRLRQPLLDTVVSYTNTQMVVATAPAAFNMVAAINIPVSVVLAEGKEALTNIITRFKQLMPNTTSEMMLVTRSSTTGVLSPQVPEVYRYEAECGTPAVYGLAPITNANASRCKRGPTSTLAAELAMATKTSGWTLQQDYRFEPVIAAYAYLAHLDMGIVVEQSAVEIQAKSLQVILNILDTQNAVPGVTEETAVVHYAGTPACRTFDRFADCDSAELCYRHPIDPARYGVIYRSDCKNCRPLPIPTPSVVTYLTRTLCRLDVDDGCSMAHDRVAYLPLLHRNSDPLDVQDSDYRGGRDVIAVYSYVPSFSVGIILKVDAAEVQRPIINNVIIAVVIAALIIIIGLIALILFSRTVLNRIEQEWLRYKILIDAEKEKYNNLIKTIVPPRIKRDLDLLGRNSLTIPNVALSFVDVINFTDSVREWHVDLIAKFVTYYQFTVRALLNQYQIDRVRFVGDAVFSAAGLSAAETNRGRRNRKGKLGKDASAESGQTGTSGNTGGSGNHNNGGLIKNDAAHTMASTMGAGAKRPSRGSDQNSAEHGKHGKGTPLHGASSSPHRLSGGANQPNSKENSHSTNKRSASMQSSDSDGFSAFVLNPDGSPATGQYTLSADQRKMARRPPIYRQACYAAALIEVFGPRYAHYPETVPEVEGMFSAVTAEHGAVFPNVYTSRAGNPEEVGSVIMPAMRIGIHCGPATFSMLEMGNTPAFDMFGPSVALAKRMEATCTANRIHLTEQAKELLEMADTEMVFSFDAARKTAVKGIGTINSYFVESADIVIPDELFKVIHVQHAVRRVYHEEFAAYANDNSVPPGGNPNKAVSAGGNNNNSYGRNGGGLQIQPNTRITTNPNGVYNSHGGGGGGYNDLGIEHEGDIDD